MRRVQGGAVKGRERPTFRRAPGKEEPVRRRFLTRLLPALAAATVAAVCAIAAPATAAVTVSVRDYGATSGDTSSDTAAFTKAIQAVAAKGGGVVTVPQGTYYVAGVYLLSNVHVQVEAGTVFRIASGAINNTPAFMLAAPGVYSKAAAAASFIQNTGIEGVGGSFTIDVSSSPTTRNHGIKFINVKNFRVANVNIVMNDANRGGSSPTSYVAALTFQSSSASRLSGTMYHPTAGVIENVTVNHAPYGFGTAQITSGSGLTFRNISGRGGITLRFETDGPNPSRVENVTGSAIGCTDGHAAVSFSPKTQVNTNVDITGISVTACESGVRVAGGTGTFTNSSVVGGTVAAGTTAQLNDPNVTDPSRGAWIIGRSENCVSKGANVRYVVAITDLTCGV
jgi:hypothetical protein